MLALAMSENQVSDVAPDLNSPPTEDVETTIDLDELCSIYRPYQKAYDRESLQDADDACFIYVDDDDAVTGLAHTAVNVHVDDGLLSDNPNETHRLAGQSHSHQKFVNGAESGTHWQSNWTAQQLLNNRQGKGFRQLIELTLEKYTGLTAWHFDRFGSYQLSSGVGYQGAFDENRVASGIARLTFPDGTVFDGYVSNGSVGNKGIYRWADGSFYEGNLKDGLRNGYGKLFNASTGGVYSGKWLASHQHGYGIIHYDRSGLSFYQGNWYIGVPWRHGIRQWHSGNFYEGQWAAGLPHGRGTKFWLLSNVYYRGEFQEGKPHGYGLMVWFCRKPPSIATGNQKSYYGMFENGLINGYGIYCTERGTRMRGKWRNGSKHGIFKVSYQNGATLNCTFVDDILYNSMPQYLLKESDERFYLAPLPGPEIQDLDFQPQCMDSELYAFAVPGTTYLLSQIMGLSDECVAEECKGLSRVITSLLEVITDIYNVYSRLMVQQSCDNVYVMRVYQFWQFLDDVLLDCSSAATEVQGSLYMMISRIEECFDGDARRGLFCHPYLPLTINEFIDRMAISAYLIEFYKQTSRKAQAGQTGMCQRSWDLPGVPVQVFVENKMMRKGGTFKGNMFDDPKKSTVLFKYIAQLHRIYRYFYEFYGGQEEVQPRAMTLEMLSTALQDAQIIDSEQVSLDTFFEICVKCYPHIRENMTTSANLFFPISFLEFVNIIIEIAIEFTSCGDKATQASSSTANYRYTYKGKITEAVDSLFLTSVQKPDLVMDNDHDTADFDPTFFAMLRESPISECFHLAESTPLSRELVSAHRQMYARRCEYGSGDGKFLSEDLKSEQKPKTQFMLPIFPPTDPRTLEIYTDSQVETEFFGYTVSQINSPSKSPICTSHPTDVLVGRIASISNNKSADEVKVYNFETLIENEEDCWSRKVVTFLEGALFPALVMLKTTNDLLIAHGHAQPLRSEPEEGDFIDHFVQKIILSSTEEMDCSPESEVGCQKPNVDQSAEIAALVRQAQRTR